jgi:hypothetical protein
MPASVTSLPSRALRTRSRFVRRVARGATIATVLLIGALGGRAATAADAATSTGAPSVRPSDAPASAASAPPSALPFTGPSASSSASSASSPPNPTDPIEACAAASERAQLAKLEGRLLAGRADALACAQERCPRIVRRDCSALFDAIDGALPTVIVAVHDRLGADVTEASLGIAKRGEPRRALPIDGKAVALDPGSYELSARAPGMLETKRTVVVGEGEKARRIELVLWPASELRAGPPSGARSAVGPIVTGALGVASLGLAAGFGISSWLRYDQLRTDCGHHCSKADIDDLRTRATVADLSLGAGVLALGTAALWWWWPARKAEGAPAVSVAPTVGGVAATAWFRF